ncbi:MAG: NUDIX domain-containing protein [Actinobacteria bacterium]|nr:MAG: NUDIX domain-containing protein [Actinomycetota bacterium]
MGALDGWRFCPLCGEAIEKVEDRAECRACGNVAYANAVPGVEAVCLDERGRILLGRRAFDPCSGLWDLPGGFMHEDEHPLQALRREVREETALEIEPLDFLGFWLEPYDGRIVLCLAWIARARGDARPGDDLVELHWFDPDGLPDAAELAFSHYPVVLSAALGEKHA